MDPVTGVQDPAPAAPPAPEPAPTPEGSVYDPDTHVIVPKHNLQDYDGRFGEALRDARQYRQLQEQGLLDDGVMDFVNTAKEQFGSARAGFDFITGANQAQPQQQPPVQPTNPQPTYGQPAQPQFTQPVDPDERPMTLGQFRKFQEKQETDTQQAERERLLGEEFVAVGNTLRGFKFKMSAEGQPEDANATIARSIMNNAIGDVMKDEIPDWYSREDREAAMNSIAGTPASNAHIQKATEIFKQRYADFKQGAVVDFVNNQDGVPAGTLGEGPGGPVQKNFEEMTYDEKVAAVDAGVRARTGRGLGEPV